MRFQDYLRKFFINYLWLGFSLLLISIILNKYYSQSEFIFYVIIRTLESIAIAVIIASIFSFASGTASFVNMIRKLVEDIIINRDFLTDLSSEAKQELLSSVLKPGNEADGIYYDYEKYYDTIINDVLTIKKKNVRTDYNIIAEASFDDAKGKVVVKTIYKYRLYPSEDGYTPIKIGFPLEDAESTVEKIIVHSAAGCNVFNDANIKLEERVNPNDGTKYRGAEIPIRDLGDGCDHLHIELRGTEVGANHWSLFQFKSLQPTDGFNLTFKCYAGIKIRTHSIFDHAHTYFEDTISETELIISCHEWVSEGVGVSVLVARDDEECEKIKRLGLKDAKSHAA